MADNSHAVKLFFDTIAANSPEVADTIDRMLWDLTQAWETWDQDEARRESFRVKDRIAKLADQHYHDPNGISVLKDYVVYTALVETLLPFAEAQGQAMRLRALGRRV